MRAILAFISLFVVFFSFQNCSDTEFSALEQENFSSLENESSAEKEPLVIHPIVNGEVPSGRGVALEDNTGVRKTSKIYALVPEGANIRIPFNYNGALVKNIEIDQGTNNIIASGSFISVTSALLSNSDEYKVTMTDEKEYLLFLAVVPKVLISFEEEQYSFNSGNDVKIPFQLLIPDIPMIMSGFDQEIVEKIISEYSLNWTHIDNRNEKNRVESSKIKLNLEEVDQFNRIIGEGFLELDSISTDEAGSYELEILSQVGDVNQNLKKLVSVSVLDRIPAEVDPKDCSLNDSRVRHGRSLYFYSLRTAEDCKTVRIRRRCTDGVLSGSDNYVFASCQDRPAENEEDPTRKNACGSPVTDEVFRIGQTVAFHGQTRTFYSSDRSADCNAISTQRTCNDGQLNGSSRYKHTYCLRVPASQPENRSCNLDGVTVPHGQSRTFYNSSESSSCESAQRTCTNGILYGNTQFRHASCNAEEPARKHACGSPVTDEVFRIGQTVAFHGQTRTFYSSDRSDNCNAISTQRTCNDGQLNGNSRYKHTYCLRVPASQPENRSCNLDGVTVPHGQSRTFYNSSESSSCESAQRTCTNGTLYGNTQFRHASCNQVSAGACFVDGVKVADNGEKKFFYSVELVRSQGACERNRKEKTCVNGSFGSLGSHPYLNCKFEPTATDNGAPSTEQHPVAMLFQFTNGFDSDNTGKMKTRLEAGNSYQLQFNRYKKPTSFVIWGSELLQSKSGCIRPEEMVKFSRFIDGLDPASKRQFDINHPLCTD